MQIHGIKEFPDAQDQTHVAAAVGHEAVEIVDDILHGQKHQVRNIKRGYFAGKVSSKMEI